MEEVSVSSLAGLQGWVEQFCSSELQPYLQRIRAEKSGGFSPREFNDPVWKTISLTPFEGYFVDCPLFQRLRRIRQLGVVHWVYPGAIHTRFEHSLGALHQIQQLIDGINRSIGSSEKENYGEAISRETEALMRFAALCHDIGHGVMSHVSENALSGFEEVENVLLEFQGKHQNRKSRLSEVVAYYMIGSASFRELIDFARQQASGYHPPADAAVLTQKVVVGEIIYAATPLLQELISGPFDADKLDYMQRDAFMAGIPAITDVPRLAAKVRSSTVDKQKLPARISKQIKGGNTPCTIFGMAFSGARGLDELLLARVLLFDKVYRHQKVRALEGMVARLLEALQVLHTGAFYKLPYMFTDETLIEADRIIRGWEDFSGGGDERESTIAVVGELCSRLRERRLFVRASVFGEHFTGMSARTRRYMVRLLNEAGNLGEREKLTQTLASEVHRVLKILGRESLLDGLADKSLYSYLWIDPPGNADHAQKIVHAFLIREDGDFVPYQEHSPEVAAWSRAYLSRKDVGFVFCISELQPYVTLAMEGLLAREYSLRLPESALDHLKRDLSSLTPMYEELQTTGYYESIQFALRPEPERLQRADVPQLCDDVRNNVAGYAPPILSNEEIFAPLSGFTEDARQMWLSQFGDSGLSAMGMKILANANGLDREEWASIVRNSLESVEKVSKSHPRIGPLADERIRGWLAQFERPELIDYAIYVLSKIRMIGRPAYKKAVNEFCQAHPEFKTSVVVALGDAKDSGRIVAYLTQDTGLSTLRISAALKQDQPILFVDDFVGSGSQVKSILADWFGEAQEGSAKLGESTRQKLEAEQIAILQSRRIAFVFAAGWKEGGKELMKACGERGLKAEVYIGETENALPSIKSEEFMQNSIYNSFCNRCKDIARSVLSHTHPSWDKAKLESRLLGYGNKGLLIVFPFNTPTQSLTCLWASGQYKAVEWHALFPRRPKE